MKGFMKLYKSQEYHPFDAKKAELLAPAGSYETMVVAVAAGADAVYLGGSMFGARAYANNLDTEALKEAIDFVHLHGRKLYLTVNTLLKEQELKKQLYSYLSPLYEHGLDAVIVQDIGVFSFIKKNFPNLSIHASTQMTLTGPYGAKLLKDMGAERIVVARELSLKEIRAIHKTEGLEGLEIESFVHGALCYCYSGQCLFSSIAGGRSGNRGRCAQPCRLPYRADKKEELYLLSPKDLCSIELLPDILEAGVYSLKIEGRMKKAEYTAGVVSVYRKYLDYYIEHGRKNFIVSDEDKKILNDLYNRGGFTKGYYKEKNGRDMMFFEGKKAEDVVKNEALWKTVRESFFNTEPKEVIYGRVIVKNGEKVQCSVTFQNQTVTVFGKEVSLAQKQPITEENIRKQIEKTGGTPFFFADLSVETDQKSFIRVTELNELRRNALKQLADNYLKQFQRQSLQTESCFSDKNSQKDRLETQETYEINVYLEKREYVASAAAFSEVSAIYFDSCEFSAEDVKNYKKQFSHKKFYYVLPHIFRDTAQNWLVKEYDLLLEAGIDGFVVKNLDELSFLREKFKETSYILPVRLDFSMYGFNRESMTVFEQEWQAEQVTLPVELNNQELSQIADKKSELVVYGYLPMMVSAQCMVKNLKGCNHTSGLLKLTDRYKNEFIIKNRCKFCYNRIYNCKPLSLLCRKKEVDLVAPHSVRLDFTLESAEEVTKILYEFIQAYREDVVFTKEPYEFTRGHWKRGIE